MYEMLHKYQLIQENEDEINTIHLCEAPGAFINATNHYIKTTCGAKKWNWFANSLNPYYEKNDLSTMLDDDRFIIDTIDNWCFGKDNTGNIMNPENIQNIWEKAKQMEFIHLITGDGSVSCIDNPNEQEENTAPLHFSEIVCGLGCLKKGGNFVVKTFTLFEHTSICKLYLLGCLFEKVSIFKPATSKAGNSETYMVCRNFKGIEQDFLQHLLKYVGISDLFKNYSLFSTEAFPETFLKQIVDAATFFADCQRETIQENLDLENQLKVPEVFGAIKNERKWVSDEWLRRFKTSRLNPGETITKTQLDGSHGKLGNAFSVERTERGSLSLTQRRLEKQEKTQETSNPPTPQQEFSSPLLNMMKKMGYDYTQKQGLGIQNQGITEPIEVTKKKID